jgi:hypothetical protein
MSPTQLILAVTLVVAATGAVISWIQRLAALRGYAGQAEDLHRIAAVLRGKIARVSGDILIAGDYQKHPTLVRFSHQLNMPGMHVEMRVRSTMNFSVVPKKIAGTAWGKAAIRTGSDSLDTRFNTYTDDPAHAHLLLSSNQALTNMEKLCCSTQTDFAIKPGSMQLSELAIPQYAHRHLLEHLESMASIARFLQEIPGAARVVIQPVRKPVSWTIRVALALGLAGLVVLLFLQKKTESTVANGAAHPPETIADVSAKDAEHILQLQGWHVVQAEELSRPAVLYLRDHGLPVSGHLSADFAGRGDAQDAAYSFANDKNERRVTMLAQNVVVYDAVFPKAELIAIIPREKVSRIGWATTQQIAAEGDALLVVEDTNVPNSSLAMFKHGTKIYSVRPADSGRIEF